jgi:RHS repeat-associated protein
VIRAVYESGNLEEFVYDNNGNREKHITKELASADPVTTLSTFNNLNQLLGSEIEGADGSSEGSTHIRGRVVDKNVESVTVNGIMATIEGETYSVEDLPLQSGENAVVVEATDKAGNETVETFTLFFDPKARATYRYDLNGNLIQKTVRGVVWRYAWDAENRLTKVKKTNADGSEGVVVEYGYFDNGNRAWKRLTEPVQEPVVTSYVHDGIHVIAEYNGEGELLKEYVYSGNIDEVLNIKEGSTHYYPIQDGLNSVVAVTNAGGEQVASYEYEAFGEIKSSTGSLGNLITYTGRWLEPETGLYYYRARYYDSGVGRFLKRDSIGFESKDYNFYRYVFNSPLIYNDPDGSYSPNNSINYYACVMRCYLLYGPGIALAATYSPYPDNCPFTKAAMDKLEECLRKCRSDDECEGKRLLPKNNKKRNKRRKKKPKKGNKHKCEPPRDDLPPLYNPFKPLPS